MEVRDADGQRLEVGDLVVVEWNRKAVHEIEEIRDDGKVRIRDTHYFYYPENFIRLNKRGLRVT